MSLRQMHEKKQSENTQSSTQESSLQLIEEQSQTIAELQQRVSELSLTNSELTNELRSKSETIKSLNEKIGTLSESDKVLQLNAKLQKLNEQLREAKQEAEQEAAATIWTVKREYARKTQELEQTQAAADQAKKDAEATKKQQNELIKTKAKEMYQSKEKSLISAYKSKKITLDGAFFGSLAYGVLVTLFVTIRSRAFMGDFKAFFSVLWAFISTVLAMPLDLAIWAAQLGDMIPQPIVAVIVHWLILIAVILLVGGGVVVMLLFGVFVLSAFCAEVYADTTNLAVALASLAISVFFGDAIREVIPINLLFLLIITQAVYIGVRWHR